MHWGTTLDRPSEAFKDAAVDIPVGKKLIPGEPLDFLEEEVGCPEMQVEVVDGVEGGKEVEVEAEEEEVGVWVEGLGDNCEADLEESTGDHIEPFDLATETKDDHVEPSEAGLGDDLDLVVLEKPDCGARIGR